MVAPTRHWNVYSVQWNSRPRRMNIIWSRLYVILVKAVRGGSCCNRRSRPCDKSFPLGLQNLDGFYVKFQFHSSK